MKFLFQAASPSAGQFTALGIYLLTCLFFVVGAMIEFAILLHLRRTSDEKVFKEYFSSLEKPYKNNGELDGNNTSDDLLKHELHVDPKPVVKNPMKWEKRNIVYNSHKIDYIAIVAFGVLFCAFNVIYWVYYLMF